MDEPCVLVVEDDLAVGRSLVQALANQALNVEWARTGADALRLASSATDLVLLDLNLPDFDGVEICRKLRERYSTLQILVVTARTEEIDIVVGLDAGADDYLTKPFGLAELLARVRTGLRRLRIAHPPTITVGALRLDLSGRKCWVSERPIDLRAREFELLCALAAEPGRVVTRRRLLSELWDLPFEVSTKTLDMHISALRRKLGQANAPPTITTVRGVGYRLDETDP